MGLTRNYHFHLAFHEIIKQNNCLGLGIMRAKIILGLFKTNYFSIFTAKLISYV